MNKEKQRFALALHYGAKVVELSDGKKLVTMRAEDDTRDCYTIPAFQPIPEHVFSTSVPDYLNDLNAIHEAEKALDDYRYEDHQQQCMRMVSKVTGSDLWAGLDGSHPRYIKKYNRYFSATAEQRAESLLKTLKLWETEPEEVNMCPLDALEALQGSA